MRLLLAGLLISLLAAACDSTAMPTVPPITVVITAIDDTEALDDAVAQALTSTARAYAGATETVLALGGITLTPSPTLTPNPTLLARPTNERAPTATPTPTITPTATFLPYPTVTPDSVAADTPARMRIIHAWMGTPEDSPDAYDVYINGEPVSRALSSGQETGFQQVAPGIIQVTLRIVNPEEPVAVGDSTPPAFSEAIQVEPGANLSLVLGETTEGLRLLTVPESAAPLPDGMARLTIVQVNPGLLPANVIMTDTGRALAYGLRPNDIMGSLEVPVGTNYLIDLYDVVETSVLLGSLPPASFGNRISYLLVMVPAESEELTGLLMFSSKTRILPSEVHARLVNVAQNIGPMSVEINDRIVFSSLPIGISDPFPLSTLGNRLVTLNADETSSYFANIPAWTTEAEQTSDKIVVLFDNPASDSAQMGIKVYAQDAPRSAINSQVRLIHALPGTIPLSLEMRPVRPSSSVTPAGADAGQPDTPPAQDPFVKVTEAEFSTTADYTARAPDVVNVRVVLSGTRNVIAEMNNVQLVSGAVYDFVILPGTDPGSARLVLVQQPRTRTASAGSPAAISEAVNATLTAIAPVVTATPTRISSPTPTRTPLPTNTPRATNTPDFPPPSLGVDPAPPNTTRDRVLLYGQGFPVSRPFSVFLDNGTDPIHTGLTTAEGAIMTVVNLPVNMSPGLHTIHVCVAGICPGNGTVAFAVLRIAPPNMTPTATLQP